MISQELKNQAVNLIKQAKKILIIPSAPADGDSLGSTLALYSAFKKIGKEVTAVCTETIPEVYRFLKSLDAISKEKSFPQEFVITIDAKNVGITNVRHEITPDKVNIIVTPKSGNITSELISFGRGKPLFDLIVMVDGGGIEQFKTIYEANIELFQQVPILNIDHHVSNNGFGKVNYIDVMASSTTVLITDLIETLDKEYAMDKPLIDPDIATHLLVGLITDTGSFQNPNTTPDAFAVAAHLVELGGRQQEIIQHVYKTRKLSTLKLWGRVLSKIQYDEKHHLVWSAVSAKDFSETESQPEETEGVIDELMSNAPGAEIIVLLKDRGDDMVSGSIRTVSPAIPASSLAEKFGGGGHLQAAGFKVQGKTIQEVESNVVSELRKFQAERLKLDSMS